MIFYDNKGKQILTPLCRQCPDKYFSPASSKLPHVGCCSYSPVFTLFEIYKMITAGQQNFFLEKIYNNPANTIRPYEIIIHADIHPMFFSNDNSSLSALEYEDKKLTYSVCQFFAENKGCSLPSIFKTSICRSFICTTIEGKLEKSLQQQLTTWSREIHEESREFNHKEQQLLERKGWNLSEHVAEIIGHFSGL